MDAKDKARFGFDHIQGRKPDTKREFKPSVLDGFKKTLINNGYRAFLPRELEIALAAMYAVRGGRKMNAIQAGANDGMDLVFRLFHKYFDRVILVEPQARLMELLKKNYENFPGQAHIENVAIGNDGSDFILHVPDDHAEEIYIQKMGRSSSYIVGSNRPLTVKIVTTRCEMSEADAEKHTIATRIPSFKVSELARKHGFEEIDFLQVDCEGYDWHVVKSLEDYRPYIIHFESKLLSKPDWAEWEKFAGDNQYGFLKCGPDTLAIRHAVFDSA